uniref:Serpentine Receptor, class J n=1 Tax=Caenorhabditis tropicalis TaxID=1561998 RepID=A0A1I7TW86_9PELO
MLLRKSTSPNGAVHLFWFFAFPLFTVFLASLWTMEGSFEDTIKAWICFTVFSITSGASLFALILLRHSIIALLKERGGILSEKTQKLHKQLIMALTIQLIIPTTVCFIPSVITMFLTIFGKSYDQFLADTAVIAYSIFPFLDPLAIIFSVPAFRRKLVHLFDKSEIQNSSNIGRVQPI